MARKFLLAASAALSIFPPASSMADEMKFVLTSSVAADMIEMSDQRCRESKDQKNRSFSCAFLRESGRGKYTVASFIEETSTFSLDWVYRFNGWTKEQVNPQSIFPTGKFIIITSK